MVPAIPLWISEGDGCHGRSGRDVSHVELITPCNVALLPREDTHLLLVKETGDAGLAGSTHSRLESPTHNVAPETPHQVHNDPLKHSTRSSIVAATTCAAHLSG